MSSYQLEFLPLEAGLKTDRTASVLYAAQVAKLGEAKGHGVELDSTTLDQIVELGNSKPGGIKVRFGHPSLCTPALGTFLGVRKNFVRDGDFVRADLHMSKAADQAKAKHVLDMAEHEPHHLGNSVVISASEEFREGPDGQRLKDDTGNDMLPVLRVSKLHAVDVVDEPASGTGMFAEPIPGVELSAREIIKLQSLLDNPEVVSRALEALQARAGVKVEPTPPEAPAPVTDALSERERVSFIMRASKGKDYLSMATGQHKDGLVQYALESGMDKADFLAASLELAHKAASMRELELCSDDIPVESCDPESKPAPRGASIEQSFFECFKQQGHSDELARTMAATAARRT